MKKDISQKILITICLISFMIFFGVTLSRTVIFYNLYDLSQETGTLLMRSDLNGDQIFRSIYHFFALSAYSITGYIIFILSMLIIFITNYNYLKQYGWLFMIIVLVFLFAPFEFYMIYRDIKVNLLIFSTNNPNNLAPESINEYMKFKSQSIISLIGGLSFLSQLTVLVFSIFKPLHKFEKP